MAQTTLILGASLATPTNAAFSTADTGGSLAAGTYYYRVSALNAEGESLASAETSQVVPPGTSTNKVTVNWGAVTGATGYKVYGRDTGAELLIATVGAVTTYEELGAITPAGALPAANTATARTPVTTSTQTIADGASNSVGLYTDAADGIPPGVKFIVKAVTPGNPDFICELGQVPQRLQGPCSYTITRPDITYYATNVGAYKEA